MRNIKLVIEYDGTHYCGWQVQKNALSIQQVLQKAIEDLAGHSIKLTGSSRTDAGVHAKGMTANFFTECGIPVKSFPPAINTRLPHDIVVIDAEEMEESFHSRYSSTGKRYSYTIINRAMPTALLRNYAAHVYPELDTARMERACSCFLGTHDFSAFKSSGGAKRNPIRTIRLLQMEKTGDIIKIHIEADGFLYNMVRIIAGTLIEVGLGKIEPHEVPDIIDSLDRKRAGKTAPAQGLCLERVYY
jgi:tRNA pseudouridine38-40 synthase